MKRSTPWRRRVPWKRNFPWLLLLLPLLLLAVPCLAQGIEGLLLTNELRNTRARLQFQHRDLTPRQLDQLAYVLGRSNYLARAIEQAVMRNDLPNAERLLKDFPGTVDDINILYGFSGGLLSHAVQSGSENTVAFLLAHQANPNRPGFQGEPPLIAAIRFQRWSIATRLLEAGANAAATNSMGQSPLEQLCQNWWSGPPGNDPRKDLLLLLLDKGADPFAPASSGLRFTSGNLVIPSSVIEQVLNRPGWQNELDRDLLLTNHPSPLRRTPSGQTALHLATIWGRTNALEFLLNAGFSPDLTNALGLTPLQLLTDSTPPQAPKPGPAGPFFGPGFGPSSAPFSGPRMIRGFSPPGLSPALFPAEVAEFLLKHGATLDLFSAAGLGRTNELAALLATNRALSNARDGCGRTPLHYAVSSLRLDAARLLLRFGAALDATNSHSIPQRAMLPALPAGLTPLHLAVLRDSPELVRMLLHGGAPPSLPDAVGDTPLHLAAGSRTTNVLAALIAARATLDATNHSGQTPLAVAAASGSAEGLELLFQAHASPTYGLGSNTLAHLAAARGSVPALTVLLRHGLPLDAPDAEGRTPFDCALNARAWDALNFLRSKGANLNARDRQGNTPLHLAAAMQDDTVSHLAENSLWVKWKRDWLTGGGLRGAALQKLIQWKAVTPPPAPTWTNTSLTAWLLEHGAQPNATNAAGQTALYVFCAQPWQSYSFNHTTNRVTALLQAGAQVELRDAAGLSSLHVAATNVPPSLLMLLAQHVQHPENLRDAQGRTPLHYAAQWLNTSYEDHGARLGALLASGLSPDTPDSQGRTPLFEAVATYSIQGSRQEDLILTLLTNRANPNVQDAQGRTPLHQAMQAFAENPNYGIHEACLLLLTNHAQPNLADRQGRTPLHLLASMRAPTFHPGGQLDDVLLNFPWDFAAHDRAGQTPIHLLCSNLNTACSTCAGLLRAILTNTTLVQVTNGLGDTPLHVAIRAGRTYTVPILLHAGANPAQRNARGETAYRLTIEKWDPHWPIDDGLRPPGAQATLFNAIFQRDRHSFDLWLQADPSLCSVTNSQGQTPLQAATDHNLPDFAQRLLELGAPMDLLSALRLNDTNTFHKLLAQHQGSIPSHWLFEAVRFQRTEPAQALLDAGGNVQATDAEGHSLAYRAHETHLPELEAWFRAKGCRDTLFDAVATDNRQLLEQFLAADPSNLNATNGQARTPLLAALAAGKEEEAAFLLERGANIHSRTPEGWGALHLAAANNLLAAGRLLLRAGADPNELSFNGIGPLHLAATLGRLGFAELLLTNGAEANLCSSFQSSGFGNSPLHWAVQRGGIPMVKLLLAHGADPKLTNSRGATPADLIAPTHPGFLMWFVTPPGIGLRPPRPLSDPDRTEALALLKAAEARAASSAVPPAPLN